jgi:hypothetical protein
MAEPVHALETNKQMHAQFTADQFFCLRNQLAQATPVTKKKKKKKEGTCLERNLLLEGVLPPGPI